MSTGAIADLGPSVGLCSTSAGEAALEAPGPWRAELLEALAGGARLVSLFGRRADEGTAALTAVLQGPSGALRLTRCAALIGEGVHSLTEEHPAFHCFERELHEQLGLKVKGHPWMKPLRFEGGGGQSSMNAYPYHSVEGKDVHEVAVGPVHAGVIEPGSFRFMCHGERVLHLEIQLGYQHRGVERLLLGRDPRRLGPLVETAAGDTSVAHAWAYCAALEALAEGSAAGGVIDGVVDGAVERGRALLLELERVAMHLSTLSGLAADIGFLQGATAYGRLRTTVINATMRLTGSRFGRSGVRPGASAFRFDAAALRDLEAALGPLTEDLAVVHDRLLSDVTVQLRLVDVGVVSPALAAQIGLVGVAARASGQRIDQRSHDAGLYAALPLRPQVESSGDCLARTRVRVREIHASLDWIRRLLAEGLELQRGRVELGPLRPNALVVTVVEGLRGEVVHALETDARGALLQYKVQDPSLRNWLGLALAVRGGTISDFPICNKSFDLSYCGHDL